MTFRVALTFDTEHPDRPSERAVEERLLDRLAARDVRATFFVQGRWAEAYPALARRIADDGHLIGSHSHYHARMPLFTARGLRSDIAAAQAAIIEATGADPRPWFRCPFGAGSADRRVQRIVREAGYRHVGWNVAGVDWPAERTAAQVESAIVDGALREGNGTVVLLHAWPDRTLGAIDGTITSLVDAGATLVRIDELDRIPEVGGHLDDAALGGLEPVAAAGLAEEAAAS